MGQPKHGGHLVARILKQEGVRHFFTLSGGHIAPIYDGVVAEGIRLVDFRHEQSAAHAADGWARVTLETGVVGVTPGPGVTDAVTGIANAMYANSPVLLLTGTNPTIEFGMGSLQEMDHVTLLRPVTKWAGTCIDVRRLADGLRANRKRVPERDVVVHAIRGVGIGTRHHAGRRECERCQQHECG